MRISLLVSLIFLLTGCFAQHRFVPQSIQVAGDYKPLNSGLTFPERFNEFNRAQIIKFDEKETNIGVGYNHVNNLVALTLYVYPSQEVTSIGSPQEVIETAKKQLFDNNYEFSKNEIMSVHKGSALIKETPFALKRYEPHFGKHAVFKYSANFAGRYQGVKSHLFLIQIQDKLFKYRATYPEAFEGEREITEFIESFDLL